MRCAGIQKAVSAIEHEVTDLLEICRRDRDGFTLHQIVSRVIDEKPANIGEYGNAWNELTRRGLVRLKRSGRPNVYEVVPGQA
jgi:hypothetical protein